MNLPQEFQFSQGSLQDFVDCKRRFQLRYIEQLSWPAIAADPILDHERDMDLGIQFHRLVQQHQLGIDEEKLTRMVTDDQLKAWWQNYLQHHPKDLPEKRHTEILLSGSLEQRRLVGKYDLIAVEENRAVIVDWKTSRNMPKRQWLEQRLQTRVYRYLLTKAGAHLNNGKTFEPEQISMMYWFANAPETPEIFPYDATQYAEDEVFLSDLIQTIERLDEDSFTLTEDERHCRFCAYRSLCDRGTAAGNLNDLEDELSQEDLDIDLDLEHIAEIEF